MPTTLMTASRALNRQKIAVERTLCARSAEESELAARWANAWHLLVERKLDKLAARTTARNDFAGFMVSQFSSPSRTLH